MGDSFEVAVDVDATLDEAPELAGTVVKWLSDRGIIGATPTDDRDAWGAGYYLPGPDHRPAVVHPGDPYVVAVAQSGRGRLEVTVGRAVFYPTQGTPGPAVCPLCRYAVALVDPETGQTTGDWELFSDALADWHDGGPGTVVCPNNGSVTSINEWQWQATGQSPSATWASPSGTGRGSIPALCPSSAANLDIAWRSPAASCRRWSPGGDRPLKPSGGMWAVEVLTGADREHVHRDEGAGRGIEPRPVLVGVGDQAPADFGRRGRGGACRRLDVSPDDCDQRAVILGHVVTEAIVERIPVAAVIVRELEGRLEYVVRLPA